jgi:purine-binding chemotaxis protein CheW
MATNQYIIFELNKIEFGLNISDVQDIIKPLEHFNIPNTPEYVEGMISLRGDVHVVINLSQRMGMPKSIESEETKIIICKHDLNIAGYIIDRVSRMAKLEDDDIKSPPDIMENLDKNYINGVFEDRGGIVYVLDLEKIMDMKSSVAAK